MFTKNVTSSLGDTTRQTGEYLLGGGQSAGDPPVQLIVLLLVIMVSRIRLWLWDGARSILTSLEMMPGQGKISFTISIYAIFSSTV